MRILTRYVLMDLLKIFLLTLTGLTLMIFVAMVGKEAVDKGLSLGPLLRMTPYLLPQAMQFAVPGTMLLATTFVFGRMSSFNEIVAIKSLGISPMTVIWPALVLATLVSLAAVVLNDIAVSWGRLGVQRVFLESLEEVVYGQLRVQRSYSSGKYDIFVRRVEGRKLIRPVVIQRSEGDEPAVVAMAEEAELRSIPEEGKLMVRFFDSEVDGSFTIIHPDEYEHEMSLEELAGGSSRSRSPSNYALGEIRPALVEQFDEIEKIEQAMAAEAAFSMLTGQFEPLSKSNWSERERGLNDAEYRLHRLHTEPWRRWATGFSCLFFVLIGAPMAIRLRHSEFLASFFACFLPILLVYYPLLMVSVDKAKGGVLPPPAVWIGNLVLGVWGLWLLRRVLRY